MGKMEQLCTMPGAPGCYTYTGFVGLAAVEARRRSSNAGWIRIQTITLDADTFGIRNSSVLASHLLVVHYHVDTSVAASYFFNWPSSPIPGALAGTPRI